MPGNSDPLNVPLDLGSVTPMMLGERSIQLRRIITDSRKANESHHTNMAPLLLKAQCHARIKQSAQVQYLNYSSLNNLAHDLLGPRGVRFLFPIKMN